MGHRLSFRRQRESGAADERAAAAALYPRSGHVIAATVHPPTKAQRDDFDRRRPPTSGHPH